MHRTILLLLLLFSLNACEGSDEERVERIPLVPLEEVIKVGGLYSIRAPLRVHDSQYPLVTYTQSGERDYQLYDAILFPTDLTVVFTEEMEEPRVFLSRAPHGGCLMTAVVQHKEFVDPCYGSHFTLNGEYVSGPAQRNLDELPVEVIGEMIWVRGGILYGAPHQ